MPPTAGSAVGNTPAVKPPECSQPRNFDCRLIDAFMTAAIKFVTYYPDSHLSGYHRIFFKVGMKPLEATKRVARAQVRMICKQLMSLTESNDSIVQENAPTREAGSDMANGVTRGKNINPSNMMLPVPADDTRIANGTKKWAS